MKKLIKCFFSEVFSDTLTNKTYHVLTDSFVSKVYICHTCKKHLRKGKLPPMARANGLHIQPVPEEVNLTSLENNLIARRC